MSEQQPKTHLLIMYSFISALFTTLVMIVLCFSCNILFCVRQSEQQCLLYFRQVIRGKLLKHSLFDSRSIFLGFICSLWFEVMSAALVGQVLVRLIIAVTMVTTRETWVSFHLRYEKLSEQLFEFSGI